MRKFKIQSWVNAAQVQSSSLKAFESEGFVAVLGKNHKSLFKRVLEAHALHWQKAELEKSEKDVLFFQGQRGPVWVLRLSPLKSGNHQGLLAESEYSRTRDTLGALFNAIKNSSLKHLHIDFSDTNLDQELGALVGLDLAAYQFKEVFTNKTMSLPQLHLTSNKKNLPVAEAVKMAKAVNTTRHLVNLPPNEVNPVTLSKWAKTELSSFKNLKVDIWDESRLKKENMNLHLGVGQGSETPPCLVHLSYRPKTKSKKAPIAFVGKGITFDTGGLDIKPSSGMRLMKKDMGGAAAVLGLAVWACEANYPAPLDFYVALAENAVDGKSFRPSDILVARNGMSVEIDNTDAEGRLVLADALDVAVKQTGVNKPSRVINLATLTGAIKVGLGAEIAGLFCNDDKLANEISLSGQSAGELNWRMPLYDKYWSALSSPFADCKNSGDGFGGAITAALFLQKFVGETSWAHLDIYAWNDKAQGPYQGAGASGQPVQALIKYLLEQS